MLCNRFCSYSGDSRSSQFSALLRLWLFSMDSLNLRFFSKEQLNHFFSALTLLGGGWKGSNTSGGIANMLTESIVHWLFFI